MPRVRNRGFPCQLSSHSRNPFGVKAQRFDYCIVDLLAHGILVHLGKGLQRFVLQPAEPTTEQITFGGSLTVQSAQL